MNFLDLGLSEETIKAVEDLGIVNPTTVQSDVIPSILQGKDVFTIAPQGCGKTISYVLPLLDIISKKKGANILVITPSSDHSVNVSDRFAVFNKYHSDSEGESGGNSEDANVVIGSPDLLLELSNDGKAVLSDTNILVVDDINLIKKYKQLENLEQILKNLPSDKQNIVYTNRRSKETQDILDKILQAPEEIKVDKAKEAEAEVVAANFEKKESNKAPRNQVHRFPQAQKDNEALELVKKNNSFNGKTPDFLTNKGILANE